MGQLNSGYRRPNFNGNQNFYASNSSLAPVPASQPKSKKKLLIIVLVAGVVLIGIFALIGSISQESSEQKAENLYDNLEQMSDQLGDLNYYIETYMGYDLSAIKQNGSILNYPGLNAFEAMVGDLDESWQRINSFNEKNKGLNEETVQKIKSLKSELQSLVSKLTTNVSELRKLKNAFNPESKEEINKCKLYNDSYEIILKDADEQLREKMETYRSAWCELEDIDISTETQRYFDLIQTVFGQQEELAELLGASLEEIEDNFESIQTTIIEIMGAINESIN